MAAGCIDWVTPKVFLFFAPLFFQQNGYLLSTAESDCGVFSTQLTPVSACQTNVTCGINHKSKMNVTAHALEDLTEPKEVT